MQATQICIASVVMSVASTCRFRDLSSPKTHNRPASSNFAPILPFAHSENSAHSVTPPGNFGLNLSCDNLSLERYR
jgi:hypothetical protein